MMPYKACMICDRTSGEMKTVLESLIPTVASHTTAVEDVWDIFAEILTNFDDKSLNQICTDCFEEIQRTYLFIEKCERSKSNLIEMVLIKGEIEAKDSKQNAEIDSEYREEVLPNEDVKLSVDIKRSYSFEEDIDVGIEGGIVPLIDQDIKVDTELNIEMDERDDEPDEVLWSLTIVSEENLINGKHEKNLDFMIENNNIPQHMEPLRSIHYPEEVPEGPEDIIIINEPVADESPNEINRFNELNTAPELIPMNITYQVDESAVLSKWKPVTDGFRCMICSKDFGRKSHILRHMKLHINTGEFTCTICLETFRRKDYLKFHYRRKHSEESKLYCSICSQKFVNEKYFSEHMRTHTIDSSVSCQICGNKFTRKNELDVHLLSSVQNIQCCKCSKSFKSTNHLKNHLKNGHLDLVQQCEFCIKTFKDNKQLKSHMKTHKVKCKICLEDFLSIGDLNRHIKKRHSCEYCCKSFHSMAEYHKHTNERLCGSVEKVGVECRYCNKRLSSNKNLSRHLQVHSDERPFRCEICSLMFKRKDHLKNHLKNLHKMQMSNTLKEKLKRLNKK